MFFKNKRFYLKKSKSPEYINESIVTMFTTVNATFSQKSNKFLYSPLYLRTSKICTTAFCPIPLIAPKPNKIDLSLIETKLNSEIFIFG